MPSGPQCFQVYIIACLGPIPSRRYFNDFSRFALEYIKTSETVLYFATLSNTEGIICKWTCTEAQLFFVVKQIYGGNR